MTHYIKVPGTVKAIEAAQSLIRAIGLYQDQAAYNLARASAGRKIYIWGNDTKQTYAVAGSWNPADGSIQPGDGDTLTDLTPLFRETQIESELVSVPQAPDYDPERYRVKVRKVSTEIGCQIFKNSDILHIAELVKKAMQ